jgi:hypothetical protein
MTYIPDLTAWSTHLAVGFLSARHHFPRGRCPHGALDAICELIVPAAENGSRGLHPCEFCPTGSESWRTIEYGEKVLRLGNAEILVPRRDRGYYLAPTLIAHYIVEHEYLPPSEFLEAVLALPTAQDSR